MVFLKPRMELERRSVAEPDVDEQSVGRHLLDAFFRLADALRRVDLEAAVLELTANDHADCGIVVDIQHGWHFLHLTASGKGRSKHNTSTARSSIAVPATCPRERGWRYHAMLAIDLSGRRALVAGVADDGGYGFAIAKALAEAGATVCIGTWPPALNIFRTLVERGKIDDSLQMKNGEKLVFERIYPLDAAYDNLEQAPEDVRTNKRYRDIGDFSVEGLRARMVADFGQRPLDLVVHSLANSPDIKQPLLETSRSGYLTAVSVSAYSMISLVSRLGPVMRS